MNDLELITFIFILAAVFFVLAVGFYVHSRRLKDFRTLKLGRLMILTLASLLLSLNLVSAGLVSLQTRNIARLMLVGLAFWMIELAVLLLVPLVVGIVLPIAVLVLTVKMWRHESRSVANLLLPLTVLVSLLISLISVWAGHLPDSWLWLRILALIFPFLSFYMAWEFTVFFLSSWIYGRRVRKLSAAYHVVLGAGLVGGDRVGRLLGNRIRAGIAAANPGTILLLSGGQGPDEKLAEAVAMRDFAVKELNFPQERTLLEDKSRTTFENLKFSAQIIAEQKPEDDSFMFFTSDYHVFRAALFAAQLGLNVQGGTGGKTAFYYRVPAFIREFVAVLNMSRWRHMIVIALIVLILGFGALVAASIYNF